MKGVAVRLGRETQEAPKVQAQRGCRTEATAHGNALDGFVRGFQEALGEGDALLQKPVIGAGAQRGAEAAGGGGRAPYGAGRPLFVRGRFVQKGGHPREWGGQRGWFRSF